METTGSHMRIWTTSHGVGNTISRVTRMLRVRRSVGRSLKVAAWQPLLCDNGVFGLRYDAFAHVYLGTCRQDNATITYRFDAGWTWDRGDATGTLKGDLLEVRYSDIMQQSDFENAVYGRLQ